MNRIKNYFKEYWKSLKSIHPVILSVFVVSVVVMNILANNTIYQNNYIALDGGIIITWLVASICDIVTINKGPKTTIRMSIFALLINVVVSLIFLIFNAILGQNSNISNVFGTTWFIILSSAIAFICSTSINAILNFSIGKCFKENDKSLKAYCARCYLSTLISQFIDNFIFSAFAFMIFGPIFWDGFSWSIIQVACCASVYAGIALLIEIIVTPIGYKFIKK